MSELNIVADENIPMLDEYFASIGSITRVNGRQLKREQLLAADILLVRSVTRVDASLLAETPVRFVATATIGIDHLDTDYLDQHNIVWASAPGCNADSVVEYVFSACCRLDGVIESLFAGAVVGIVGMGNVGSRLYQRLLTLGVDCVAYDPLIAQDSYPILTTLDEVLMADIVCLHTPLTKTGPYPSLHLFDQKRLEALKNGAVLINAGRGDVIDGQALKALLQHRDDLCVVLDVWKNEPNIDIDLMKRIDLATPHIAGYSYDGKLAGTRMIYQACCAFLGCDPVTPMVDDAIIEIELTEHRDLVAAIKELVFSSYDIAEDDQRMRGRLLHCKDHELSEIFDGLRKKYPLRREFSRYKISNAKELDQPFIDHLVNLGFGY